VNKQKPGYVEKVAYPVECTLYDSFYMERKIESVVLWNTWLSLARILGLSENSTKSCSRAMERVAVILWVIVT
jgi:uncharacterized membrane protein